MRVCSSVTWCQPFLSRVGGEESVAVRSERTFAQCLVAAVWQRCLRGESGYAFNACEAQLVQTRLGKPSGSGLFAERRKMSQWGHPALCHMESS